MEAILADLNDSQRRAVQHPAGPLMVVAGAGSGKTRVITRRIAYLLHSGVPSHAILALTFTNKAAGEMGRRVLELHGEHVHVATFHSACARFLRRDAEPLGFPRNFTIYDTHDRDSLLKILMQERGFALQPIKPSHVGRELSRLKNLDFELDEYRDRFLGRDCVEGYVAELWDDYHARLQKQGAMDFDDLLVRFNQLLHDHPEVAERYQSRFQHVLIDEFQDTNRVQYRLAKQLAKTHRNLCVVGDPDQSIYGFRGAQIRNILDFQHDFPDVTTIRLETNYRSTKRILAAAQGIIVNNAERLDRDLTTDNVDGDRVVHHTYDNHFEENDDVGRQIEELIAAGTPPSQIAVFYRSHYLSRGIEDVLRRALVPYDIVGGLSFFERREIKDVLAYLRVAINPLDDLSLERVINVPARGIGTKTVDKIRQIAAKEQMALSEMIAEPDLHQGLSARARKGLADLAATLAMIRAEAEASAAQPVRTVLTMTDYVAQTCDLGDPQDIARQENVGELVSDAVDFDERHGGGLSSYLERVSLMTSEDRRSREGPTVSLMTVHAAKGLEFDHVFLIGLDDGLFPSSLALDEGGLEEERRLMYVAITRGRRSVHLSSARSRMVQGAQRDQDPSRFVDEIPPDCLRRVGSAKARPDPWRHWDPDPDAGGDVDVLGETTMTLRPKTRVVHPQYGPGVVVRTSGRGYQARAVVRFEGGVERELLLEYADLQVVSGDPW